MDPLTILAVAQTAYSGLKAGIAAGKEIRSMAKDLSDLWGSLAKLTQLAAEPPQKGLFNRKSAEQIAIERYTAKAEAQDLALKAKNMFVGQYGLAAWDQVQREVISIRKEIEKERWEEARKQAQKMEDIREAAVVSFIVILLLTIMMVVGIILLRS